MIVLITFVRYDEKTGVGKILVSHGVDRDTLKTVILPTVVPDSIGEFNKEIGAWVLR